MFTTILDIPMFKIFSVTYILLVCIFCTMKLRELTTQNISLFEMIHFIIYTIISILLLCVCYFIIVLILSITLERMLFTKKNNRINTNNSTNIEYSEFTKKEREKLYKLI
jgi:high-affinity nickel permease